MDVSDFNDIAWSSFMKFAANDENIVDEYREATGRNPFRELSPVEIAIDAAVGYNVPPQDYLDFIYWVTENYWGIEFAPKKLKEEMEKRA